MAIRRAVLILACAFLAAGATARGSGRKNGKGALRLIPATKVEKAAGVWVDGKYMGYVSQFAGRKPIPLAPGDHELVLRETGYKEFTRHITLAAGGQLDLEVRMEIDPRMRYSAESAEIRIHVAPSNAAVYLDGAFAGTVNDFGGIGRAMLAPPGKHTLKISSPGYEDYVVALNLEAGEKYNIETKLTRGTGTQQGTALKEQ
ncbi:MAG TPA: PEGA domain-containing protein [Candidatus Acidoferrales bacterium]|nr:PEGA domain-containing protein [Candidatus Acidoferrales bacterium]